MSENKNASADGHNSESPAETLDAGQELNNEIKKLSDQAEKFKNDYLYLRAEFDNYKRHAIKDRADLLKYGAERLGRDLLSVLDNFERALSAKVTAENFSTFVKGVEMTAVELRSVLNKNGFQEVPCEGKAFDPMVHEALSSEPTDAVPAGHVVRVFQKGYKIHDKVVRPAQVVVAQKPN